MYGLVSLGLLKLVLKYQACDQSCQNGPGRTGGLESPQKIKGVGRKIAARIISRLFSPVRQSPKPGRVSPSGLRAARKPAKKLNFWM